MPSHCSPVLSISLRSRQACRTIHFYFHVLAVIALLGAKDSKNNGWTRLQLDTKRIQKVDNARPWSFGGPNGPQSSFTARVVRSVRSMQMAPRPGSGVLQFLENVPAPNSKLDAPPRRCFSFFLLSIKGL